MHHEVKKPNLHFSVKFYKFYTIVMSILLLIFWRGKPFLNTFWQWHKHEMKILLLWFLDYSICHPSWNEKVSKQKSISFNYIIKIYYSYSL